MSEVTQRLNREALEALAALDALLVLAKANFPKTRAIRIETAGHDPKAIVSLPWHTLVNIATAARETLSKGGE